MKMKAFKNVCTKCNNIQNVNEEDVFQDISGKFIVCGKCETFYNVEPEYLNE